MFQKQMNASDKAALGASLLKMKDGSYEVVHPTRLDTWKYQTYFGSTKNTSNKLLPRSAPDFRIFA